MAAWVQRLHALGVAGRRRAVLAKHLADVLPDGARVLDVGCGDGGITAAVAERRPDLELRGIDVFVRERTFVPVEAFDGVRVPYGDDAFDAVMFVDVLHHTREPASLLRDAARVARRHVVLKDHLRDGFLADATLRLMDRVGNPSEGVEFPSNYWPAERWRSAFEDLGLRVEECRRALGLYPVPLDWVFGRGLHFIARLVRAE